MSVETDLSSIKRDLQGMNRDNADVKDSIRQMKSDIAKLKEANSDKFFSLVKDTALVMAISKITKIEDEVNTVFKLAKEKVAHVAATRKAEEDRLSIASEQAKRLNLEAEAKQFRERQEREQKTTIHETWTKYTQNAKESDLASCPSRAIQHDSDLSTKTVSNVHESSIEQLSFAERKVSDTTPSPVVTEKVKAKGKMSEMTPMGWTGCSFGCLGIILLFIFWPIGIVFVVVTIILAVIDGNRKKKDALPTTHVPESSNKPIIELSVENHAVSDVETMAQAAEIIKTKVEASGGVVVSEEIILEGA